MLSIFKPAAHIARVPSDKVDPLYRKLRWQIFLGIFFGYAAYYLVRKNFTLAMPYLIEQGFSRGDLGFALSGISIAYGFSKFIMGSVSDRSNPRVFLPAGLILAAAVMLFMGFVPWATSSIAIMFVLLFLCGWFQGMGWPPCGRTMVHWWSQKERGGIVSIWNCAHNVGGGLPPLLFLLGMAWFNDWHAALYMPAFGAILVALIAFALMRDTPQSCGLPPIEEYKNDYPDDYSEKDEEELTAKQIFMQYILPNKLLWYIAVANVFVYLLRYGIPGHPAVRLDVGQSVQRQPRRHRRVLHDAGDHRHRGVLDEPGRQPDRGHDLYAGHRLPDLRPGDADRPARAGAGAEESRRHRRGLHRPVRLPGRLGRGQRHRRLHRGLLRLGRRLHGDDRRRRASGYPAAADHAERKETPRGNRRQARLSVTRLLHDLKAALRPFYYPAPNNTEKTECGLKSKPC
jgi:OPA family glycerol-3-phosphate transporter-like MFS transporter